MGLAPTSVPGAGGIAGALGNSSPGAGGVGAAINNGSAPSTGGAGGVGAAVNNSNTAGNNKPGAGGVATAINKQDDQLALQKVATSKGEPGEDITISVDPVKDVLVFPHQNNRTYRSGYVQLMAFANDYNLKDISGAVDATLDYKQKHTKARERAKTFNGDASAYLANARANNRRFRKIPGTKLAFTAILPMPLGIAETTVIDWNSSPSGFNQQIVGAANQAGSSWLTYIKSGGKFNSDIQGGIDYVTNATNGLINDLSASANVPDFLKSAGATASKYGGMLVDSTVLGSQVISGAVLGDNSMHSAALNSVAGSVVTRPTSKMMQLQGPIMDYVREASAINGRRQIVTDLGYWQQFQGVNPRNFTLKWTIIPENHEDAMNGLALCARLKEFSLPEHVSSVEMLSPHYWQIQFSNPLVQSQLLYNNLVIKNIDVSFMESGEIHLSGTPKKFDIAIQFEEAKAPSADVFKVYDEKLILASGKLRNSPSKATASIARVSGGPGGGLGGKLGGKLGDVFSGKFGGLGSGPLGKLGDIASGGLGKLSGLAGGAIGGLSSAIGSNLGGTLSGYFGDYAGN